MKDYTEDGMAPDKKCRTGKLRKCCTCSGSGYIKATNNLMLVTVCWFNKYGSIGKLTKGLLLLIIISNVTSNTEYTINGIVIRFPLCCIECCKHCNKHSSKYHVHNALAANNDCPLEH
jgi:hypothetical protein